MATIKQIQIFVVTCVIGDQIVRMVDDVVCMKGPPEVRAEMFACRWHPGPYAIGWQVWCDLERGGGGRGAGGGGGGGEVGRGGGGGGDVDKKGSEEVMGRYRELVMEL